MDNYGGVVRIAGGWGYDAEGGRNPLRRFQDSRPAGELIKARRKEFGTAARAGKLFRFVFGVMRPCSDGRMVSRMTKVMFAGLQQDRQHRCGERTLSAEGRGCLAGFEFNADAVACNDVIRNATCSFDRDNGIASITVCLSAAALSIVVPAEATHFRLRAAAGAVDFDRNDYELDFVDSEYLPVGMDNDRSLTLVLRLGGYGALPVYQVLGLQFYTKRDGWFGLVRGYGVARVVGVG